MAAAQRIGAAPVLLALAFLTPLPVNGGRSLLGLPNLCPFHNLTGHPCPGCGLTRSVVCLTHGHFADALLFHPLGPAVLLWLVGAAVWRLPLPERVRAAAAPLRTPRAEAIGGGAFVAALLAIWIVRLLGYLPSPP